jgi:hypothetical protein
MAHRDGDRDRELDRELDPDRDLDDNGPGPCGPGPPSAT